MTTHDLIAMAKAGKPLERQREALAELIASTGIGERFVDRVIAHTRDGVTLRPSRREDTVSRLGGAGLLPVGEPWPTVPSGYPMHLVAAIDLSEMPALGPLPADGLLQFYWDFWWTESEYADFVVGTRVIWSPPGTVLEERLRPSDDFVAEFEPLPVAGYLMPITGEAELVLDGTEGAERIALIEAMNGVVAGLYGHQLLGSPREIQGPVLREVPYWFDEGAPETRQRFSEAEKAGEGWMLLAQIEEDREIPSLGIGDGGALYFLIPEIDLAQRRFDRVMGVMQCH